MSEFDDDPFGEPTPYLSLDGGDEDDDEGGDDDGGDDDGGDDDGGGDDDAEDEAEDEEEDEAEEEEDEAEDDADDEEDAEDEAEDDEDGDDEEEGDDDEDDADDEEGEEEEGDDEEDEEGDEEDEEDGDDEDDDEEDEDDDDDDDDEDDDDEDDDDDGELDEDDEVSQVEDSEIYASAEDFESATEEDFEEDDGSWTDEDYYESAEHFFSSNEYYSESYEEQFLELGWELVSTEEQEYFYNTIAEKAPAAAQTVTLFKDDQGQQKAGGFVSFTLLTILTELLPDVDWGNVNVTVPDHPNDPKRKREPNKPLPTAITNVDPADSVDLRKYASPVGDQGQTMRCSAFAWTHANELLHNVLGIKAPPLACSYTMYQFQKLQGDAKGFKYAYTGGEGTIGGPEPGAHLIKVGTAPAELWPNDAKAPEGTEEDLAANAKKYKLPAKVQSIDLKDLRKVLASGYPVHIGMNTGEKFQKINRSGVLDAAEKPSGDHGRHAMLVVGYLGNYFIIKNSWGTGWGDKGYAYIPLKVLQDAEAELVAIIPTAATIKKGKKAVKKGKKGEETA